MVNQMAELWQLDLSEVEKEEAGPPCLRLGVRADPSDDSQLVYLTPECSNIEQLERAVEELKVHMDRLVEEAREAFTIAETQREISKEEEEGQLETAEEIWQALGKCNRLEEMQVIFNSLELSKRQEVADYILTQVNIFKGAGATFAQHYNRDACLLEKEG
jgi:hypothetical protein